jgi:hypothetical protein
MKNTTYSFSQLQQIKKEEARLLQLFSKKTSTDKAMPAKQSVDNILNYSKALSIRKTNNFGFVEQVLN